MICALLMAVGLRRIPGQTLCKPGLEGVHSCPISKMHSGSLDLILTLASVRSVLMACCSYQCVFTGKRNVKCWKNGHSSSSWLLINCSGPVSPPPPMLPFVCFLGGFCFFFFVFLEELQHQVFARILLLI